MASLRWHILGALLMIVAALGPQRGVAAGEKMAKLAFSAAGKEYHFDTGVMKGTLHAGGKALGLTPAVHVPTGTPVAGAYGIFSPYRLLTADARFGTGAWDWASETRRLADGAVQVNWNPDSTHPLAMSGRYRWTTPNQLDVQLTVRPNRDLRQFELFLASYFTGFPAACAYVRESPGAAGKPGFMEAKKAQGDWQTFPRDAAAEALYADGRWNRPPNPVAWKMQPPLAAPLALRRDGKSGVTAVLMARPEDCFAIAMPQEEDKHCSVYLSLFGRDLKAGEAATARARVVIDRGLSDAKAVELYRAFLEESR